jgi:hypothetical protein
MRQIRLLRLAVMIRMIEIHDDDVTMIVGTSMEIAEIKEAVEVVEVVDTPTGIKTKVCNPLP